MIKFGSLFVGIYSRLMSSFLEPELSIKMAQVPEKNGLIIARIAVPLRAVKTEKQVAKKN